MVAPEVVTGQPAQRAAAFEQGSNEQVDLIRGMKKKTVFMILDYEKVFWKKIPFLAILKPVAPSGIPHPTKTSSTISGAMFALLIACWCIDRTNEWMWAMQHTAFTK
jgi:hypothetical protein